MKSMTLSRAAKGTPTKFTKSFPAKANASENVPDKMMMRKTLRLKARMQSWKTAEKPISIVRRIVSVLPLIQASHSGRMKLAPAAPFMMRK